MSSTPYTSTKVIAVPPSTSGLLTALRYTSPSWVSSEGVRYIVSETVTSPRVINSELCFNYDLRITSSMSSDDPCNPITYNTLNRSIDVCRMPKSVQAAYIHLKLDGHTKLHVNIPTWDSADLVNGKPFSVYAVKPEYSARGVGIMMYDSLTVPHERVRTALAMAKKTAEGEETYDELTAQLCYAVTRSADHNGVDLNTMGDRHAGEGYRLLVNNAVCYQGVIQDIREEYRIITDHLGRASYFVKRQRVQRNKAVSGFYTPTYATGKNATAEDFFIISDDRAMPTPGSKQGKKIFSVFNHPEELFNEVCAGVFRLSIPCHSVDIFVTDKRTWGILEFSPEMGTDSVPNDFMRDIARKWVEHECVAITDVM